MSDSQAEDPVPSLRALLLAATARIPTYEAAVASAQERLRRELATVQKTRELLALLEPDSAPATSAQPDLSKDGVTLLDAPVNVSPPQDKSLREPRAPSVAGRQTKKSRMTEALRTLLGQKGSVHRTEILAYFQAAGVMGHEANPMAHLAAFLSNSRESFVSDGKGFFRLRPDVTQLADASLQEPWSAPEDADGPMTT
jgi:hypothetical protein